MFTDFEAIFERVKDQCDLFWLENLNRVLPKGSRLVVPIICSATFGEPLDGPAEGETKAAFLARAKSALEALSHA